MKSKLISRNRDAVEMIFQRLPFHNSEKSLHGEWIESSSAFGTRLSPETVQLYREAFAPDYVTQVYVVFSYHTPIAWYSNGELIVSDVRYSATTSRHQAICRQATSL